MRLAKNHKMIQAFLPDRLHEALPDGVQVRLARTDFHHFDSFALQQSIEILGEFRVQIADVPFPDLPAAICANSSREIASYQPRAKCVFPQLV